MRQVLERGFVFLVLSLLMFVLLNYFTFIYSVQTAVIMATRTSKVSKVSPNASKIALKTVISPVTQLIKYCVGIDVSKATL